MAQHATVEALIVGGGHAGLLLGTALAHAGIGVGLIERQPQEAIAEERFLILPHPEVHEFALRKATDIERWLAGMRRLNRRFAGSTE